MIRQIYIIILWMACISCFSQEAKQLTLKDAIHLGVINSTQLKLSETQIALAKDQIKEAKDHQLPDLKITGMANYLPSINLNIPALAGAMKGGAAVDYMTVGEAALSVPLFAGFKINNGIAIAKYNQQLKESNLASNQQDVIMQTIEAFVNLYKVKEAKKVVEANLARAKETERNFQNMEKNGLVARNDFLRVQLQTSNVELALAETEKNYKIINYNVNLLLGLPEGTLLDPQLDFNYQPVGISAEDYQQQALNHREELNALNIQEQIASKNRSVAKGAYYPVIALSASDIFINIHNMGSITNASMVGLSLSYNLASLYKNRHAVDAAQNGIEQAQLSRSLLTDRIRSQIHTAYENYNYYVKRTQVYEKALAQADENYRIVRNKQNNGLANTDDLLTADVQQLQAELNKAYSHSDVLLAYYQLLKEAGLLNPSANKIKK